MSSKVKCYKIRDSALEEINSLTGSIFFSLSDFLRTALWFLVDRSSELDSFQLEELLLPSFDTEHMSQISVKLPLEVIELLNTLSCEWDVSASHIIRAALDHMLDRIEKRWRYPVLDSLPDRRQPVLSTA